MDRGTNERPGTDNVTSGPMRGLEKKFDCAHRQTDGHGNSKTESAHCSGANSVNRYMENFDVYQFCNHLSVTLISPRALQNIFVRDHNFSAVFLSMKVHK